MQDIVVILQAQISRERSTSVALMDDRNSPTSGEVVREEGIVVGTHDSNIIVDD